MKNPALWRLIWSVQKLILFFSYGVHGLRPRNKGPAAISWEVGVAEISSMVFNLASLIPLSRSTNLYPNKFYRRRYGRDLKNMRSVRASRARALIAGPWWLGASMRQSRGILYVGKLGYLVASVDDREWEMRFVRSRGLAIACFLTGTDIRSTAKSLDLERERGMVHVGGILARAYPWMDTPEYESSKEHLAAVIDSHSGAVFSLEFAQASYLRPGCDPTVYAYPDDSFDADFGKYTDSSRLRIVHAPSSPLLKGTAEVRIAIERLHAEGFEFDYIELLETDNATVTGELRRAHIVLNNFFSFTPGIFGVEALANGCVMLTSASEVLEPGLPSGCDLAWIRTAHTAIYSTLAALLAHPEVLEEQARRGYEFARRDFSAQAARASFLPVLDHALASRSKA